MSLPVEILHRALFASIVKDVNATTPEWKTMVCSLSPDAQFSKWPLSMQVAVVSRCRYANHAAYNTMLHCARHGKAYLCRYIVDTEFSSNDDDLTQDQLKGLFEAAVGRGGGDTPGHVETVQYLLENFKTAPYASPNSPTVNRMLRYAATFGRINVCRYLLCFAPESKRCKANHDHEAALKLAITNDHVDVCKVLVEEGPPESRCVGDLTNNYGDRKSALYMSYFFGDCARVCRYVVCEAPPEVRGNNVPTLWDLEHAAEYGRLQVCKFLLLEAPPELRVKPCPNRLAPTLAWAALKGHMDVCRFLVFELPEDLRVNPDYMDGYPLQSAATAGRLDICRMFVMEAGATSARDNALVLGNAARNGRVDVCRFLINKAGARPNAMNHYALLQAVQHGREDVCHVLVMEGEAKYRADPQFVIDQYVIESHRRNLDELQLDFLKRLKNCAQSQPRM